MRTELALAFVAVVLLLGPAIPLASLPGHTAPTGSAGRPYAHEDRMVFTPSDRIASLLQHRLVTTQLQGAASPSYPYLPTAAWLAYAPWDRSFYVAVPPSSVDVISDSNYSVMTTIPVGNMPFGVAVDNATREVFVTNTGSGNVTVINGTTQKVVSNVAVQRGPLGVAFNSSSGEVFVADNLTNNVSVIIVSSLTVLTTIHVGLNPRGIAWDPTTQRIFVADSGSNAVSVLSGSSHTVLATVPVGVRPYGVAVDTATDNVYVTNQGSNNVSVISAVREILIATIAVSSPPRPVNLQGVGFDSNHGLIWVGGGYYVAVVIDPTSESVVNYISPDPSGVVFDPDTGDVCVTNTANTTFACFAFGGGVQFTETGLPSGTTWLITLGNATRSTSGTSIWFAEASGTYSYGISDVPGWHQSSVPYSGSATVGVTTVYEPVLSFHPFLLNVSFQETGLPSATSWTVSLNRTPQSSSSPTVVFGSPNGSYGYGVSAVYGYTANPSSGAIRVNGAAVKQQISFTPIPPVLYNATFIESGLPAGTFWSVVLMGSLASSTSVVLVIPVQNGTYNFSVSDAAGFFPNPTYGTVRVSGGSTQTVVQFVPGPPCCIGSPPSLFSPPAWVSVAVGAIGVGSLAAFLAVLALTRRRGRGA